MLTSQPMEGSPTHTGSSSRPTSSSARHKAGSGSATRGQLQLAPERVGRQLAPRQPPDATETIDVKGLGQADEAEALGDRTARTHRDIWHAVRAEKAARVLGEVVDVHRDEHDAASLCSRRRRENRGLAPTRRTPRGPEVEHDRIPTQAGERERATAKRAAQAAGPGLRVGPD